MSATVVNPLSPCPPTAAEVNAILAELRPLIRSFADRDRRWLDAVRCGSARSGPGSVAQHVGA
jgi:hypothetical protein